MTFAPLLSIDVHLTQHDEWINCPLLQLKVDWEQVIPNEEFEPISINTAFC